ncbi:MAG: hypothetical protein SFU86_20025 [Pirellulaceae bacterium]|nr:hypothetical protein [Pirellulaceae bacterium]
MTSASILLTVFLALAADGPPRVGMEFAVAGPAKTADDPAFDLAVGDLLAVRSVAADHCQVLSSDLERVVKIPTVWLGGRDAIPLKEAMDLYTGLIDKNPQSKWHRRRGLVRHANQELEKAMEDWQAAIALDPRDHRAHVGESFAHRQLKQFEAAIAAATKALEIKPDFPAAWNERAQGHIGLLKWAEALADLDKYVELAKSPVAYRARGSFRLARRDLFKAREDFTQALTLDPRDVTALHLRGQVEYWTQNNEAALADYSRAIELSPRYWPPYFDRALVHLRKQASDQAIRDLDVVISLAPTQVAAYQNRAVANINLNQLDAAVADLRKALELVPQNLALLHQIASLHARGEKWREQAQALGELVEREPNQLAHRLHRAQAWRMARETENALADLTFVAAQAPPAERQRALVARSDYHLELGNVQQALDDCETSLADASSLDDPAAALALIQRAWIRATAAEEKYRDGRQAILDATRACAAAGWNDYHRLAVLAAANAEAGRFDDAVIWQKMAIEKLAALPAQQRLLLVRGFDHEMATMQARLKTFEARQPLRMPPP